MVMGPLQLTALCLLPFAFLGGGEPGFQTAAPAQPQPALYGTLAN